MSTDRIEKTIILRAPRSRVWRAISNADEFGAWFGVTFEGAFAPGARLTGRITSPGQEDMVMEITVDRVDPEHLLSYRWHSYAIDPGVDYSHEPTTLVEFHLADANAGEGTHLTVVESGFDQIPVERRATSLRIHDEGWVEQITRIARYVGA